MKYKNNNKLKKGNNHISLLLYYKNKEINNITKNYLHHFDIFVNIFPLYDIHFKHT